MIRSWADSIDTYLFSSNEDERIISFFQRIILPVVQVEMRQGTMKWLDIGTGPGTKTLQFAVMLANLVGKERVSLTMIDPLFQVKPSLMRNLEQAAAIDVACAKANGLTLERYVKEAAEAEVSSINLVTAIHLLYLPSLVEPMLHLADAARSRHRMLLFVVCEAPESDFQNIRSVLRDKGISVAYSALDDFASQLQNKGFRVQRYGISNQWCRIDQERLMDDDGYWLFPFLVGCRREEFLNGERKVRETVLRVTREYVAGLPAGILNVPDAAIIAVGGRSTHT